MVKKKRTNEELIAGHKQMQKSIKQKFNDDEVTYETFMENYSAHQRAINELEEELNNITKR